MVFFLTGEDTSSSRTRMHSLMDKNSQVLRLDAGRNSLSEILDAYEAKSLFTEKRTIIIEHFTKLKFENVLLDKTRSLIKDESTVVIFWDEAGLPMKLGNELKGAKIESFIFPKVFYQFIDGVSPKNTEVSLRLLSSLLATFAPEQVLYSLSKRIRLLCLVKEGRESEFSESARLASWQIAKLSKQASEWTGEQLVSFLKRLAETDELVKTSGLAIPLASQLDILLSSDLN